MVELLHQKYENNMDEGTLTLLKQSGVSNKTLGMIAISHGMHELILMDIPNVDTTLKEFNRIKANFNLYMGNPQELMNMKVHAIKLLGDVFEGLVGAIFIDCQFNYVKTKEVVLNFAGKFFNHFTEMDNLKVYPAYKFREYLQKNNYRNYKIVKDSSAQPENGKFRFILTDQKGTVIEECW